MFKTLNYSIGEGGGIKEVMRKAFGVDDASGENALTESFRSVFDNINNAMKESVTSDGFNVETMSSKVTDAKIFVKGLFGVDDVKMDVGGKTFVAGPAGSFVLNDKDEYYGKDGMFTAGTNLGVEKSIQNMDTKKISTKSTIVNEHKGNVTATIVIKSDNSNQQVDKDHISRVITKMFNNGGQPDGANIPQEGGSNVLQSY